MRSAWRVISHVFLGMFQIPRGSRKSSDCFVTFSFNYLHNSNRLCWEIYDSSGIAVKSIILKQNCCLIDSKNRNFLETGTNKAPSLEKLVHPKKFQLRAAVVCAKLYARLSILEWAWKRENALCMRCLHQFTVCWHKREA